MEDDYTTQREQSEVRDCCDERSSKTDRKRRWRERRRGTREHSKTDADVGDDDGLFDNLRRKPFG